MSGEPVEHAVIHDPARVLEAPLRALAELPVSKDHWALIGGIAVVARLARAHRATGDLDALVEDADAAAAEIVGAVHNAKATRGTRVELPGAIGLDLIDATPASGWPDDLDEDPDSDTHFLARKQLVFTYAHLSATPMTLTVRNAADDYSTIVTRVATPSALVALKLHAALTPQRNNDKRGTDVHDTALLLERYMADSAESFATFPPIHESVRALGNAIWIHDPARTRRWISQATKITPSAADINNMFAIGIRFLDMVEHGVVGLPDDRSSCPVRRPTGQVCGLPFLSNCCIAHGDPGT